MSDGVAERSDELAEQCSGDVAGPDARVMFLKKVAHCRKLWTPFRLGGMWGESSNLPLSGVRAAFPLCRIL
jgi:hypothetical protein